MNPIEKIKEQRLIEATRKNYLGIKNGKLGIILRYLGTKVWSHGSPLYDITVYSDPYEEENEDELPTFDEEEMTAEVGYIFDGLSRGMHLEIKYLEDKLSVHYQGHLVFLEKSGDLEQFVPNLAWEDKIEDLYKVAVKLQRKDKKEAQAEKIVKEEKIRKSLFKYLLETWGYREQL